MTSNRRISRGTIRTALGGAALCAAIATSAGCQWFNREQAQPLTADAFTAQRVEGRANPEPIDRPGQVIVGGVKPPEAEPAAPAAPEPHRARDISAAVRE